MLHIFFTHTFGSLDLWELWGLDSCNYLQWTLGGFGKTIPWHTQLHEKPVFLLFLFFVIFSIVSLFLPSLQWWFKGIESGNAGGDRSQHTVNQVYLSYELLILDWTKAACWEKMIKKDAICFILWWRKWGRIFKWWRLSPIHTGWLSWWKALRVDLWRAK